MVAAMGGGGEYCSIIEDTGLGDDIDTVWSVVKWSQLDRPEM